MQWNLAEFFKNESELENFIKNLYDDSKKFSSDYKENLQNLSSENFLEAMRIYEKIENSISKVMSYSELKFCQDTTTGSNLAKYEEICNEISQNILFFELEFINLDDKKQEQFIEFCQDYKFYLTSLKKAKSHKLSLKEEKVLLKTSPVGTTAFSRLFDESMAKLKFSFDDKFLSEEEILALLHNENREIRKKAALSLSKTLEENSHLLTYILNMIKTDLRISCNLRNYECGEMIMHEYNKIDKESVDSLIIASENSFDIVHKFYNKKREILGFDTLYDYDRYAPLNSNEENFSYEESKKIVLSAFENFNPEFAKIAKMAFENSWIDVYPKDNKTSGAFSHSASSDMHPFVLLNFTNKRRDLFTLAHELGHAIHQYLAKSVGFLASGTPLTTAETASVFCEMIVFDYVKNLATKENKKAMLASKIEDIFATLYRQINFTTFEREIHKVKDELSSDEIAKIWMNESKKMFGDSLVLNDYYKLWYSYIPHFIHSPFYCYSYAYAQLLVLALYGLYKSKKCENFIEKYTHFLSLGGSKSPKEMVKIFNLDIDDRNFWNIGINEVRNLVEEFINE